MEKILTKEGQKGPPEPSLFDWGGGLTLGKKKSEA